MARTINGVSNVRGNPAGPAAKAPRVSASKVSAPAVPRPHRFQPCTRARMEIRKWRYREHEKLLIRRLPFSRLVREIAQDFVAAIEALQYAAESHVVKLFEDANLLAQHAKRITIYKTDLMLVRRIRGEIKQRTFQ